MVETWGEDETEVTRDVDLECDVMTIDDEYCGWVGSQTLDGFEYEGIEYFDWECPKCGDIKTLEDVVR